MLGFHGLWLRRPVLVIEVVITTSQLENVMVVYSASCRGVPLRKRLPLKDRNVDAQNRVVDSGFRIITAASKQEVMNIARVYFKSIKMPFSEYREIFKNLEFTCVDAVESKQIVPSRTICDIPRIRFLRKRGRKLKRQPTIYLPYYEGVS